MTSIEWTEATWNPIAGCSVVSPGCTNCYAMRTAARLARIEATAPVYAGLTQPSKAGPVWTGRIEVNESALLEPLRRRKPTMYFVNSMSDLFHESVPDEVIDRVFAVMALCPQHTFQVLTKRSARMREFFRETTGWRARIASLLNDIKPSPLWNGNVHQGWQNLHGRSDGLPNVWLGVSVEDQKRADDRIPDLLATPAAVRFLSCEPMLGPVDLTCIDLPGGEYTLDALTSYTAEQAVEDWRESDNDWEDHFTEEYGFAPGDRSGPLHKTIDWVIVGGESGPGARPMHPDWARSLRDQCADAGVPFFFKQWGEWAPHPKDELLTIKQYYRSVRYIDVDTGQRKSDPTRWTTDATMRCMGKKRAGRLLDGVTHDAMPQLHHHG